MKSIGSGRPLLSLAMIVKNEARNIDALLTDTYDLFDEIVACDTGSTDITPELLESYGAIVTYRDWDNDFSAARNAATGLCTGRWIVWLDADDRMRREDLEMLRIVLSVSDPADSIYFLLLNLTENRMDVGSCRQLRCFPNVGAMFQEAIHEQIISDLKPTIGPDGFDRHLISYPITVLHTGYSDLATMKKKWGRNLSMLIRQVEEGPNPPSVGVCYRLAQTLEGMGARGMCLPIYLYIIDHESSDGVTKFVIARSGVSAAQIMMSFMEYWYRQAEDLTAINARRFPQDDLTVLLMAQIHLGRGRFEEARQLTGDLLARGLNAGILPFSVEEARRAAKQVYAIAGEQISLRAGKAA